MTMPETPQKFPRPEEIRQNLEESFKARMREWLDVLTRLEGEPRILTEIERAALGDLQSEIKEVLTKPYEPDNKKALLRNLLVKIEGALRSVKN